MHLSAAKLLLITVVALFGASAPALAQSTVTLKLHESVTLSSIGKVTFIHAQDDRCPVEVECLVPGNAYALLWVELGTKKALIAVESPQKRGDLEIGNKFFGSEFCFVSLEPKPSQVTPTQVHMRVLTVLIKQSSSPVSSCSSGA